MGLLSTLRGPHASIFYPTRRGVQILLGLAEAPPRTGKWNELGQRASRGVRASDRSLNIPSQTEQVGHGGLAPMSRIDSYRRQSSLWCLPSWFVYFVRTTPARPLASPSLFAHLSVSHPPPPARHFQSTFKPSRWCGCSLRVSVVPARIACGGSAFVHSSTTSSASASFLRRAMAPEAVRC